MARKTLEELRSQRWFDNPGNPSMTALYLERHQPGRPAWLAVHDVKADAWEIVALTPGAAPP